MPLSAAREFRGQGGAASAVSFPKHRATVAPVASPGVFPANLHGYRRCFPERWAAFLRAHFQGAAHVAAFFDVDHHTARAWLSGRHGANAAVALYAINRIPGALRELTGEAA